MKLLLNSATLALALMTLTNMARADVFVTATSFSGPLGFGTGLQYFDPSLGTLDSVDVLITGTLTGTVQGAGSCSPACVPADYAVMVSQNFTSANRGQLFSFDSPAQFVFTGAGSVADLIPIVTQFSYSFEFNNFSDLIGSAPVTPTGVTVPPVDASGTRAGFLTPSIPISEIDVVTSLASNTGALLVSGLSSDGAIVVTYNYTPVTTPPPTGSAVPEPSAWAACSSMLLLFAGRRRMSRVG